MSDPMLVLLVIIVSLTGTGLGVVTGLLPGLHTNNVAAILMSIHIPAAAWLTLMLSAWGLDTVSAALVISCLIVSASITHTFVNFIPATFLGAPEEGTALTVLPGHRMLLQGRGYCAVRLSAQGSLGALVSCLLCILIIRAVMGPPLSFYESIMPYLPAILILLMVILFLSESRSLSRTGRPGGRRDLETCLYVEGMIRITERGSPRPGIDIRPPEHEVVNPWTLEYLQGKEVSLVGSLETDRKGALFLRAGKSVRLLLAREIHEKGTPPVEGSKVLVTGQVCRTVRPGRDVSRISWAVLAFLLSGALGILLLRTEGLMNDNWVPVKDMGLRAGQWLLMPLFTGLFGLPTLGFSLASGTDIPSQAVDAKERLSFMGKLRAILSGAVAGATVGWMPGVTSAEAGVIQGRYKCLTGKFQKPFATGPMKGRLLRLHFT